QNTARTVGVGEARGSCRSGRARPRRRVRTGEVRFWFFFADNFIERPPQGDRVGALREDSKAPKPDRIASEENRKHHSQASVTARTSAAQLARGESAARDGVHR